MKISVIIPHRNRWKSLKKCLEALSQQDYNLSDVEVIVVDDCSENPVPDDILYSSYPYRLKFIILKERKGPGGARNRGVGAAEGEIIAFLEDDVIPDKRWLKTGVNKLLEGCDVVEGITIEKKGKTVRKFEKPYQMMFLACNLIVKKSVFEKVGGYKEYYFDRNLDVYFREDTEFGIRAMKSGANCCLEEQMVVFHPPQHLSLWGPYRHTKRFYFDPLLYKEHPDFFREFIGRKKFGFLNLKRPLHRLFVLNALSLIGMLITFTSPISMILSGIYIVTLIPICIKYHSSILQFPLRCISLLPISLWYLYWFLKGCWKFRGWGALL